MKQKDDYFTGLDLFSFNALFCEESVQQSVESNADHIANVTKNASAYLQKGVRMETLAREMYKNEIASYDINDVEKDAFSISLSTTDGFMEIIHKISKKVVRPLLRSMKAEGDEYHKALLSMADESFHLQLSFGDREKLSYILPAKKQSENENLLELEIVEDTYPPLRISGTQLAVHPSNRKNVLHKSGLCVADLGDVLSFIFLLSEIKSLTKEVMTMDEKTASQSITYHKVTDVLNMYRTGTKSMTELKKSGVILTKGFTMYPLVRTALKKNFVPMTEVSSRSVAKQIIIAAVKGGTTVPMELTPLNAQDILAACWKDIGNFYYHDFLHYKQRENGNMDFWGFPCAATHGYVESKVYSLLKDLFLIIWEEKSRQTRTVKYFHELSSTYAKSFQQKKQIPQKILNAMEESYFNQYFGYVEFDESVDITRAKTLADEFIAMKEAYFPFVDASQNAIRFRRLGKHRAAGLYFPMVKCLCVDVNYPSSLTHEFGHLIDYAYGKLSEKWEFTRVRSLYEKNLREVTDETAVSQLSGNGKYNLSYYLEPTEIFARSLEIYLVKIKGVHNSLVPGEAEMSWQYPANDAFLEAVTFYFNNLFADLANASVLQIA